jgi:hypothetical protein
MRRYAIGLLLLTSCGGSATGGGAPPSTPQGPAKESTETTGADHDGVSDKTKGGKKTEATTMVDLPSAQSAFDDASKAFAAAGSDCVTMCKALQSMARATERLCELAGDGADAARCTDAKSKLEGARAKVKATCGGACE